MTLRTVFFTACAPFFVLSGTASADVWMGWHNGYGNGYYNHYGNGYSYGNAYDSQYHTQYGTHYIQPYPSIPTVPQVYPSFEQIQQKMDAHRKLMEAKRNAFSVQASQPPVGRTSINPPTTILAPVEPTKEVVIQEDIKIEQRP